MNSVRPSTMPSTTALKRSNSMRGSGERSAARRAVARIAHRLSAQRPVKVATENASQAAAWSGYAIERALPHRCTDANQLSDR